MISGTIVMTALFAPPVAGALASALPVGSRAVLRISSIAAAVECAVVCVVFATAPLGRRIFAFDNNLFIDTLSLYHIALVSLVFFMSSVYSMSYFSEEIAAGGFTAKQARRFGMIWNAFFAILTAVLCCNNMGLLWVCLEATTLVSALLILTDKKPASIEATWKYLLLCSVGIAFAFVGTLLLSVASHDASLAPGESLLWTALLDNAAKLDGRIMMAAFIFVVVGFGTKAGLAPMHTWLPDAHSQAPTPVSSVFSGIMLNCALYCIMRYLPLCETAMGWNGRPHSILILFGLLSIVIAAVFIPAQKNIKRLLAYHSVEHIGIITLGLGVGGLGTFAALFHTLNHSLSKTLAFFSAGRLARQFGTYDMHAIKGAAAANPLWGTAFFISVLALLGVAPFSIFFSEFQLIKASIDDGRFIAVAVFLFGSIIIFTSALRHAMDVSMGGNDTISKPPRVFFRDYALVVVCAGVLAASGMIMPQWYIDVLKHASAIVEGLERGSASAGGLFK